MTGVPHWWLTVSIVTAMAYLAIVGAAILVAALRAGGRRNDPDEQADALSVSRFTIPVSIVVPVGANASDSMQTVSAALALNYPEHEVIAVLDGLPGGLPMGAMERWGLEAREFFYRRSIDTAPVRRLYRSRTDARLLVVDKAPRGWTDAVNCGVNIARYRYVAVLEPGVVFDSEALLRLMSAPLRNPAQVLGASGHVEVGVIREEGAGRLRRTVRLFQRAGSLRLLMESRLARQTARAGLSADHGIAVWRRDAVLQVNGFSPTAADSNLDMMRRLQTSRVAGVPGWFHRGSEVFGYRAAGSARHAWPWAALRQAAVMQTAWSLLRDGRGHLPARAVAKFVASEVATPLAQTWIVCATLAAACAGWFPWRDVVLVGVLLSFGRASMTTAAALLRGSAPGAPEGEEMRRLLLTGPLEFLIDRPARAVASLTYFSGAK